MCAFVCVCVCGPGVAAGVCAWVCTFLVLFALVCPVCGLSLVEGNKQPVAMIAGL